MECVCVYIYMHVCVRIHTYTYTRAATATTPAHSLNERRGQCESSCVMNLVLASLKCLCANYLIGATKHTQNTRAVPV